MVYGLFEYIDISGIPLWLAFMMIFIIFLGSLVKLYFSNGAIVLKEHRIEIIKRFRENQQIDLQQVKSFSVASEDEGQYIVGLWFSVVNRSEDLYIDLTDLKEKEELIAELKKKINQ
ncbi:MAG: hypothetical protein AAFZ63_15055 [Bacteroidota bacterium]